MTHRAEVTGVSADRVDREPLGLRGMCEAMIEGRERHGSRVFARCDQRGGELRVQTDALSRTDEGPKAELSQNLTACLPAPRAEPRGHELPCVTLCRALRRRGSAPYRAAGAPAFRGRPIVP